MTRALVVGLVLCGCGGDGNGGKGQSTEDGGDGATTDGGVSGGVGATGTGTSGGAEVDGSGTSAGGSETGATGTTGEPEPAVLCDTLEFSFVVDPAAPVLHDAGRQAVVTFLDDMVTGSGAEVRLLVNVGTEALLVTPCLWNLDADAADGPVLIWGRDFEVNAESEDALQCLFDNVEGYSNPDDDDGTWMFSGLLFPMLYDLVQWPQKDSVSMAMMLASADDNYGGMYSRPGMASEAFIRIAGDEDRQHVASFAMGVDADELELFTLSLGDSSHYADFATGTFEDALAAWTPTALQACDDHDYSPMPEEPRGCEFLDILFVVDGSLSMDEEQAALRGTNGQDPVFKDFTDALLVELDTLEDFRVGVVSSEPGDTAMHTHTDLPEVPESPATDCGLPPGQRWIVGPSPTLEQDFACIGATKANTEEITVYNAAEALHDMANSGFVREDSILFVVLLTDEETWDASLATRVELRTRILDAVDGDLNRLVVLGIAGSQGIFEMPRTVCTGPYGGASPGRRISSIVYSFRDQGLMQDICGPGLADAFAGVLETVVTTCESWGPEG